MEWLNWLQTTGCDTILLSVASKNIITAGIIWGLLIKYLKYQAKLTPGKEDDEAVAEFENMGNDIFRKVGPVKK